MGKRGVVSSIVRVAFLSIVTCGLMVGVLGIKPQKVNADACSVNGRDCYHGYFTNAYDGGPGVTQHNVLPSPALLNVHGVEAFIDEIRARLSNCTAPNNNQNQTGAAFIVLTMLSAPPGTPKAQACARWTEWNNMVRGYANAGLVDWDRVHNFGGINTRSTYTDVTYYPESGSALSIVFNDPNGGPPRYAIKKDCGNPIGRLPGLVWDYDLRPSITMTDSSGNPVTGAVEPGETVTFRYYIRNYGGTPSPTVNCYGGKLPHAGYYRHVGAPESGGTPLVLSCPRAFGVSTANILVGGPEPVVATANTTICRTLFVNPTVHGGAARGTEVCVPVASRPYVVAFGGDVKTGGDVETAADTCALDNQASIATWNKHNAAAGYAGAGVQYAALATGLIKAFATAQGSPAGNPGMPSGLAFASTTQNHGAGSYGGGFGTGTCIKDYYGAGAGSGALTLSPSDSVSALVSGKYAGGNTTLSGGNINPGQKTQLFIDGDLYINGNIQFVGSWSYDQIPMFEVIVRGNIYVDNDVQRLDGVYIAQPRPDNSKGYIYTCTTSAAPPTLTAGAFYNSCVTNKLTVNGSFVARHIQLLRTGGTLRSSVAGETKAANNAAESFNYGPGFWVTQPNPSEGSGDGEADNYDAITSLPPVL